VQPFRLGNQPAPRTVARLFIHTSCHSAICDPAYSRVNLCSYGNQSSVTTGIRSRDGEYAKDLERIPDDRLGWKPHEKSMTLGRLAGHIAELPGWAAITVKQDPIDVAPVGSPPQQGVTAKSRQEALDLFDAKVAEARAALAGRATSN